MNNITQKLLIILFSLMLVLSSTIAIFAEDDDNNELIEEEIVEESFEDEINEVDIEDAVDDEISNDEDDPSSDSQLIIDEDDETIDEDIEESENIEIVEIDEDILGDTDKVDITELKYIEIGEKDIENEYLFLIDNKPVAYYSGNNDYFESYTLTFLQDVSLKYILFGDPYANDIGEGDIKIQLNGHQVNIVIDEVTLKEKPDLYYSIYSGYNLTIIDKYGYGSINTVEGFAMPICVKGSLTLDSGKLNLYDSKVNYMYGVIYGRDLYVLGGEIHIDNITSLNVNYRAGIFVYSDMVVNGGKVYINYYYDTNGETAGIYAGNYKQHGGDVYLSFINNDFYLKEDLNNQSNALPDSFAVGIAAGDLPYGTTSNVTSGTIYVDHGSLNVDIGYTPNTDFYNVGIFAIDDVTFVGDCKVSVKSKGCSKYSSIIPYRYISCIESSYGDGNITLGGYANVVCNIENVSTFYVVSTLMAYEGDVYIKDHAYFKGTIGDADDFNYLYNIKSHVGNIYIEGSSYVNTSIGNVSNVHGTISNISADEFLGIYDFSSVSTKVANVYDCNEFSNIIANSDSLEITGHTLVNASVGNVVKCYSGYNIYLCESDTSNDFIIHDNANVNVSCGNIYESEFTNLGTYNNAGLYIYDNAKVNVSCNNVNDSAFYNIYANDQLLVNNANVNITTGNVKNSYVYNFFSLYDYIYIQGSSNVLSTIKNVYIDTIENSIESRVDNFYAVKGVYFTDKSNTIINNGDFIGDVLGECITGVDTYNNIYVENNASLSVNGGVGNYLLYADNVLLKGGNVYLNLNSILFNEVGKDDVNSALIYINDSYDNCKVVIEDAKLYGYNLIPNGGYGIVHDGEDYCYLYVDDDSEVVLDVLSYSKRSKLKGLTKDGFGGSYLFYGNISFENVNSTYCYGSPYITGLYGRYSDDPELLNECRYVMFSYRPYIIPDFDDDTSDDTKHVVPNTGV